MKEPLNQETEDAIYFYTDWFEPISNFSAHSVRIWGILFPTVEHAYQWKKFAQSYPDIARQIHAAGSPGAAKQLADIHRQKLDVSWHDNKEGIMEEILRAKLEQHRDVREVLKQSAGKTIIENSPTDDFWGIGPDKKGRNTLGKLWMKIRDKL